ncbi:MAG: CehA/McbA family metallohydrolase [Clostridiales bacterium]|jgi:hypothetical protein|nr:CehA/McbA family metallohydrolase [Clostridiales bacterium]
MNLQKLGAILISVLLLFGVSSCGTGGDVTPEPSAPSVMLGQIRGKVLTDNGEMVTAGIVVENSVTGARRRYSTNTLSGYAIGLEEGTYKLYFIRGPEYSVVTKDVKIENFKVYNIQDVRLVQLSDVYAKGWAAGDLHQHSIYSDGTDAVDQIVWSDVSNGLYYGFLTDHNSAAGLAEWRQGNRITANIDNDGNARLFGAYEGLEVTTEFGHIQALGASMTFDKYEILYTNAEKALPADQLKAVTDEKMIYIAETIKRNGGIAQINHPFSISTMGYTSWDVVEYFDVIEVWNGYFIPGDGRYEAAGRKEQNYKSKMSWYELLNKVKDGGKFLPATTGTDNHDVSGPFAGGFDGEVTDLATYQKLFEQAGKYSGATATYVRFDGTPSQEKTLDALKNGNSFMSNGPIVLADINGKTYGETASVTGGTATLNIEAFARDGYESIRIIKNGEELISFDPAAADGMNYTGVKTLTGLNNGDWIIIEVLGYGLNYAITNPIFISL